MISRLVVASGLLMLLIGCGSNTNQTSSQASPASASVPEAAMLKNQSHINEGMQELHDSNVTAAIKSFDEAIKQNPKNPQGYLVLGQTYLRLKDYDRAIDTFSAAVRVAPRNGEAYYLLAVSYGLAGNGDMARENAQKSVTIFQNEKNQEKFVRSVALLKGLSKVQ